VTHARHLWGRQLRRRSEAGLLSRRMSTSKKTEGGRLPADAPTAHLSARREALRSLVEALQHQGTNTNATRVEAIMPGKTAMWIDLRDAPGDKLSEARQQRSEGEPG
jgi:hypothetical protein